MSRDSDELVEKLIESAADGTDIDWDEIDRLVADPDLQRLIQHLRVVAGVADLHRSHVDDVGAPPASSTRATAGRKPTTHTDNPSPGEARRAAIRELRDPGVPESVGQWGHLLLVRKIGEGAFGEVYHAHDTWLDHAVALIILMDFGAGEFIGQAEGGPRVGTPLYLAPALLSGGAAGSAATSTHLACSCSS